MVRRAVTLSLIALGIGCWLLAGSVAFTWDLSYADQQPYRMTVTPVETVSSTDAVLSYAELSPDARTAFDGARQHERYDLWSGTDQTVLEMLRDHEYIRYEDRYYRYELESGDRNWGAIWTIVVTFGILGLVVIRFGISRWRLG